jgi:hypothetical protein
MSALSRKDHEMSAQTWSQSPKLAKLNLKICNVHGKLFSGKEDAFCKSCGPVMCQTDEDKIIFCRHDLDESKCELCLAPDCRHNERAEDCKKCVHAAKERARRAKAAVTA